MRWTPFLLLPLACASAPPVEVPSASPSEASPEPPSAPPAAAVPTPGPPPALPPPSPSPPSSKVEVDVINGCSKTVDFCVQVGRSEKQTRLAANAHERYAMEEGDRVRAMDGLRCGDTLYEVTAAPAKQEAKVCDD